MITPPPAVHEGPFDPRPDDAPPPWLAPYRYLIAYRAVGDRGPTWYGNLEYFSDLPLRSDAAFERVRQVIADALAANEMKRHGGRFRSELPKFGPGGVCILSAMLLAKEA